MKTKIILFLILIFAFSLRLYGINWDQGFHLHPDERMLIMVADRINFFKNLNPDFFNYGSLPIYLLKGSAQLIGQVFKKNLANYADMLDIGRKMSVFFDLVVILLIYKISRLLFTKEKIALLSSFFYTIIFFAIQNSHFFVVDVPLNTFITGLIYTSLVYLKSPSIKKMVIISVLFAAMMATKFTALIFSPVILLVIFFVNKYSWKRVIIHFFIFVFLFLSFYYLFMPYAFIENKRFINDIKQQLTMNSNPYIFPYTLQYVGTLPYLYYLKNIFLWGMGPIISILSITGLLSLRAKRSNLFLFLIFYFFYFLIVGRSAVKFMRYMLPLYPFFAILAGYGLYQIQKLKFKSQNYNSKLKSFFTFNFSLKLLPFAFLLLTFLWTLMFVNIYSQPNTRISATDWIIKNIPAGSTLAIEHWDDGLPLYGGENYKFEELTLYDQPDDEAKWQILNEKLKKTDYIIIASNRLYVPLQKLSDCKKYKSCYPKTAEYYQKLFNNQLSFKKVAEFSSYPQLKIGPPAGGWKFEINDDSADESFTVYDHPKIIIFKKNG